MTYEVHNSECIAFMRTLPDNHVDAIVTDPPYELGFMGKSWDKSGIANSVEMWSEALRILKHGGHLLAFSGSRTYHRMTCAIEDAGFEVRDQIMWVYGSGFPKSMDVSKAIDKAAGAKREVVGSYKRCMAMHPGNEGADNWRENHTGEVAITTPATPAARQWQGWGTALKPAHEPICVARKPLIGTVAENVLKWGTGGINVDGCRVEGVPRTTHVYGNIRGSECFMGGQQIGIVEQGSSGRWPANLIHDGSDEVLAGFPQSKDGVAGKRSGVANVTLHGLGALDEPWGGYGVEGSAARFFYCAKASKRDRDEGCEGMEAKKAGAMSGIETREGKPTNHRVRTNHHPTVKPTELMRYLCRLVTPPNGIVFDPFTGSGSTGKAAILEGFRFIGCDMTPEYVDIARSRIEHALNTKANTLFE